MEDFWDCWLFFFCVFCSSSLRFHEYWMNCVRFSHFEKRKSMELCVLIRSKIDDVGCWNKFFYLRCYRKVSNKIYLLFTFGCFSSTHSHDRYSCWWTGFFRFLSSYESLFCFVFFCFIVFADDGKFVWLKDISELYGPRTSKIDMKNINLYSVQTFHFIHFHFHSFIPYLSSFIGSSAHQLHIHAQPNNMNLWINKAQLHDKLMRFNQFRQCG